MIPHENERDLTEIPDNIKEKLDIRTVRWIDEVLDVALTRQPEPLEGKPEEKQTEVVKNSNKPEKPGTLRPH